MRSHNANSLQLQKFRLTNYRHRLYSQTDEAETTLKIKVLKNNMFGNNLEKKVLKCSVI